MVHQNVGIPRFDPETKFGLRRTSESNEEIYKKNLIKGMEHYES